MKKLIALVLVLIGAAVWFRQSVLFSLWQLKSALDSGDVAAVEARADLAAFAVIPVELGIASARDAAETGMPGGLGAALGNLGAALGQLAKGVAQPAMVSDLKTRIEKHDVKALMAPVELETAWYGGSDSVEAGLRVWVRVNCPDVKRPDDRAVVPVGVIFEKSANWPPDYRAVALDTESLKTLAHQCRLKKP